MQITNGTIKLTGEEKEILAHALTRLEAHYASKIAEMKYEAELNTKALAEKQGYLDKIRGLQNGIENYLPDTAGTETEEETTEVTE